MSARIAQRSVFEQLAAPGGGMRSLLPAVVNWTLIAFAFLLCACVAVGDSGTGSNGSTFWIYHNGVFYWPGDWSASAKPNYKDTAGVPIEGRYDIGITSTIYGLWQPYVNGYCQTKRSLCFDTRPYKYLIFSIKPTVANQTIQVGFMSSGDRPDGPVILASSYCSSGADPPVGQWASCKMPLSVFKLTDTTVLKFWIQDETGLSNNHWYIDNVGFTTN
jgi:hypothetical protein